MYLDFQVPILEWTESIMQILRSVRNKLQLSLLNVGFI